MPHYVIPPEISDFIFHNFPTHLIDTVCDFYHQNKKLPRVIHDMGNVYYPRQMYALAMFKAARQAVGNEVCVTGEGV